MGLVTAYSDDNKIVYQPTTTRDQVIGAFTDSYLQAWELHQTTVSGSYAYVGMTEAAAITCQAAVDDPNNGVFAKLVYKAGNMWDVEVQVSTVTITKVSVQEGT